MKCLVIVAASECHIRGDPHFTTFDGHNYTVRGDVDVPYNYYFVKTDLIQIEGQLIACGKREGVYCIDTITIVRQEQTCILDHGNKVKYIIAAINYEVYDDLPHEYVGDGIVFTYPATIYRLNSTLE